MEQWKPIVVTKKGKVYDYSGLYEVSSEGKVRALNYNHTGRVEVLKPNKGSHGYLQVNLSKNRHRETFSVHRIVAEVYIPNANNLPEVNHINEDKTDCRVVNLEWCSRKQNVNHGTRNRRASEAKKGSKHPKARQVRCIETSKIFPTIKEAEEWLGKGGVGKCCQGTQQTAGGYTWEYVEQDNTQEESI